IGASKEIGVRLSGLAKRLRMILVLRIQTQKPGQTGIGAREQMAVDFALTAGVKVAGAEISARRKRHVAVGTAVLRLRRVIKATGPVTQSAQDERIVVVLAAQKLLIAV